MFTHDQDAQHKARAVADGELTAVTSQSTAPERAVNRRQPGQRRRNGLPDRLKAGVEQLSGLSMDGVQVHYNSPEPARLQALAFTRGSHIHVAPGQEAHLPHEAWHVVQQMRRRVVPTRLLPGRTPLNDDPKLEQEADVMGQRLTHMGIRPAALSPATLAKGPDRAVAAHLPVVQRFLDVRRVEYAQRKTAEFKEHKNNYLDLFHQVQVFLSDITRTRPHLEWLNNQLADSSELSTKLTQLMTGWSNEVSILVDPVPPAQFVAETIGGVLPRLFEDYVDKLLGGMLGHGVQSHRLQWFLISQEFGQQTAVTLFRESLHPVWKTTKNNKAGVEKSMWDLIVDGSVADEAGETDFTVPGNVQRYLHSGAPQAVAIDKLRAFIQQESERFNARRAYLLQQQKERLHADQPLEDSDPNWRGWAYVKQYDVWKPTVFRPTASRDSVREDSMRVIDKQWTESMVRL